MILFIEWPSTAQPKKYKGLSCHCQVLCCVYRSIRSVVSLSMVDSEVPPPAHVTQSAVKGFELLHSAKIRK